MKHTRTKNTIIGILMGIICLLWLVPIYYLVINSFKPLIDVVQNVAAFPTSLYFESFIEVWNRNDFPLLFLNSLIITGGAVALIVLTCAMSGYRLARSGKKWAPLALFYLLLGLVVPFQAVMVPLMGIMGQFNLDDSRIGVIILYVALQAPMGTYLYFGAVKGVPTSLEESATIDGAGPFRTFFSIIFPLLGPTTVTLIILSSLWIWNDFLIPLILLVDPSKRTIPTGTAAMLFGQYATRWDLGIAAILMASIPMIIFYLALQKHIVKGITDGAVKG